jgi:pyruvate, water dikinase
MIPVLDLTDIRITDTPRVGPKMARLGQLASAGWPVPDGYAVSVEALDGWLSAATRAELARLFAGQYRDPATLEQLSGQAQALILSEELPAWLAEEVRLAHERLRQRTGLGPRLRVAVRSSAVGEDGGSASFAGQFSTYLGIAEVADVLHYIRKCWASGYTPHAVEYRRQIGKSPLLSHDLAVGVLQLVDVRSAGVVFTLDPVTGDRTRLIVEANWGFGESVVSGQVTPDHWEVDRASGEIITRRVGAKREWSFFKPSAGRVVLAPLPGELAGQPCLTDDEVRYLCQKAAEIEDAEGMPQDVEWAIARDTPFPNSVFILQHRPETTWSTPGPAETSAPSPPATPARAFDPVQYALRNVFKVPGT